MLLFTISHALQILRFSVDMTVSCNPFEGPLCSRNVILIADSELWSHEYIIEPPIGAAWHLCHLGPLTVGMWLVMFRVTRGDGNEADRCLDSQTLEQTGFFKVVRISCVKAAEKVLFAQARRLYSVILALNAIQNWVWIPTFQAQTSTRMVYSS